MCRSKVDTCSLGRWLVGAVVVAWTMAASAADDSALRAYPEPMPEDVSFDAVVRSQPFPLMQYPVPIIGAKVHPEEVHVSPSGQLMFPYSEVYRGLCVAVLVGRGDAAPVLPPAEGVKARLVDGYMPGVEYEWTLGDLALKQVALARCGGKCEALTGQEPLVALVRYTVTNQSAAGREVKLAVQFGEAFGGMSVKAVPPVYSRALSFKAPLAQQEDGAVVAVLLGEGAKATFKPLPAAPKADPADSVVINERETSVKGPDYAFDVERKGDAVRVGQWEASAGVDVYVESSRGHTVPLAVEVEVVGAEGKASAVGTLYRTAFTKDALPAADYVRPGQHTAALPWAELRKALPEGKSKIALRCQGMVDGQGIPATSWEPVVVVTRAGGRPRFKNVEPRYSDENRLSIALTLGAGESRAVELAIPYLAMPEPRGRELAALRFDEELERFREYWGRELNRQAEFVVPEGRIRDAYRACLANNLLLTDRDSKSGVLMPHPDATAYEAVWAGDGSVSIQAMDRLGYHREAESMLEYFLARQGREKPEGDVQSAEGFFSGDVDLKWMNQNGFILWAMSEHYKLTHDEPWLRRVAPQMVKGCEWIARERARTKVKEGGQKVKHYGLLPKGRPSDLYIWDHWYWTDTYSYMGLRWTADVLAAVGMKDAAERWAAEADDYRACIRESVERAMDASIKPPFVPPTPYRGGPPSFDFYNETWYTISSPIYMVEAGLLDARDEKMGGTAYWLEKCGLFSGLPAFMSGGIDPYYVYNQSLTQLLRGESAKFAWTLYSISAYAMGPGTYCTIEGQNLVTGSNGEAWHANRQPHMHSNSRYIDLVRIALLLEEGETLHLCAGTPRGWMEDGQTIEVKRAPSYFGEVDFVVRSKVAEGEIAFEIEPTKWQTPKVALHVRPPTKYGAIKSVKVDGREWQDFDGQSVRLPKVEKKVKVECAF